MQFAWDRTHLEILITYLIIRLRGVGSSDVYTFLREHNFYDELATAPNSDVLKKLYIRAKRERHQAIIDCENGWGKNDGRRTEIRKCFWAWYAESEERLEDLARGGHGGHFRDAEDV